MSSSVKTRLKVLCGTHKDSVGRVLHLPDTDRPAGLPANYISLGFDRNTTLWYGARERKVKGDDLRILWLAPNQVVEVDEMPATPAHPYYTEADFARQQDEIADQRAEKEQAEMDAYNAQSDADTQARFPVGQFVRLASYLSYGGSIGQVQGCEDYLLSVRCERGQAGHCLLLNNRPCSDSAAKDFRVAPRDLEVCEPDDQGQAECDASNAAALAHLHDTFPIGAFVRLRDHEQVLYCGNVGSVGQVLRHVDFQLEVHCGHWREGHQLLKGGKPRKGKWSHTFRVPMRDVERCEPYTPAAQ